MGNSACKTLLQMIEDVMDMAKFENEELSLSESWQNLKEVFEVIVE